MITYVDTVVINFYDYIVLHVVKNVCFFFTQSHFQNLTEK